MLIPKVFGQDLDKARGYIQKAIDKDPQFVDAYVRMAQLYKIKGDEAQFERYLNTALALDPKHEIALDVKNRICKFICLDPDY